MVATVGAGWKLAPCLVALFKEADARKPTRSHASDGSIGDPSHASRESDHNPALGFVTAGDVDDDGDSEQVGVDLLVAHLVASRDDRVKYLIRNGTIWKAYENRGLPAWTPQPYTGSNPHDHHAHISVLNTPAARDDLRPWWPTATPVTEEIDMLIITCSGQPTRLLAPPTCAVIDGATIANLGKAGIKSVAYEKDDYDELLKHVEEALGR